MNCDKRVIPHERRSCGRSLYSSGKDKIHHGGTEDTEKDKAKATTDLRGSARIRLGHKGDDEDKGNIHLGDTEDTEKDKAKQPRIYTDLHG